MEKAFLLALFPFFWESTPSLIVAGFALVFAVLSTVFLGRRYSRRYEQ